MKTKDIKRITAVLVAAFVLPLSSFANNSIAKASGISDGILLAVMVGFILLLLAIIKALTNSIEAISRSPKFGEKKTQLN